MCKHGTTQRMVINSQIAGIDSCIMPLVKALNDAGIRTVASCCGHGKNLGNIALADGRELMIAPDWETAREHEQYDDRPREKLPFRRCSCGRLVAHNSKCPCGAEPSPSETQLEEAEARGFRAGVLAERKGDVV